MREEYWYPADPVRNEDQESVLGDDAVIHHRPAQGEVDDTVCDEVQISCVTLQMDEPKAMVKVKTLPCC